MRSLLRVLLPLLALIAGVLAAAPAQAAAPKTWKTVTTGAHHTCAIDTESRLYCFGANDEGQVGAAAAEPARPVRVGGNIGAGTWKQVSAGGDTTCAISTASLLWCWGANDDGQLGAGDVGGGGPYQVGTKTWSSVAVGPRHACGIQASNRRLFCWGANDAGQLGNGTSGVEDAIVPIRVDTRQWASVSVGATHTCAVSVSPKNRVWCWGLNAKSQVGPPRGVQPAYSSPVDLETIGTRTDLGGDTSCSVFTDLRLSCWGDSDQGQTGTGLTGSGQTRPTPFPTLMTLLGPGTFSLGTDTGCAIAKNGGLRCWGRNSEYQYGNAGTTPSAVPLDTGNGWRDWTKVSVGERQACGIRTSGRLYCWGAAVDGEAGTGEPDIVFTPTLVAAPQKALM